MIWLSFFCGVGVATFLMLALALYMTARTKANARDRYESTESRQAEVNRALMVYWSATTETLQRQVAALERIAGREG